MIFSSKSKLLWCAWMLAGILFAGYGLGALQEQDKLQTDRNPFAIQGSAYGRLLARLSETTVDRVWHLGVEQIVPHLISGDEHHDDHDAPLDEIALTEDVGKAKEEPLERAKNWLNDMRVVKYTRTNPFSLSERHLATVTREIEELLLRSYRMDPGHYGAYNSYHLFLTTHDFGGTPAKREHAKRVAHATLAAIQGEDEDPEPWLTAAAAAMNLYIMESEKYVSSKQAVPLPLLEFYQKRIGYCLERFDELQRRAEDEGTWQNLSFERQYEISDRSRFAKRSFQQFDAMIARSIDRLQPSIEKEVAEILNFDR